MKALWAILAFCFLLRVAPLVAVFIAGVVVCYYSLIGPPVDPD